MRVHVHRHTPFWIIKNVNDPRIVLACAKVVLIADVEFKVRGADGWAEGELLVVRHRDESEGAANRLPPGVLDAEPPVLDDAGSQRIRFERRQFALEDGAPVAGASYLLMLPAGRSRVFSPRRG